MPPVPAPPGARLLAAVVVVVFRCFRVLPPPAPALRGADSLLGEREPLPTDVELAGAGYNNRRHLVRLFLFQKICFLLTILMYVFNFN